MAKQTAVEWLIEFIQDHCIRIDEKVIEQAKAMEKEQIIEAFTKGELVKDNYYDYSNAFNIKGQNYYKKTYDNNK